ncbi:HAD-like domain-containing protein [Lactifluus subvellereus]|nr:HAD-like domain-containing protein [Lactifluus subvellereus]
MNMASHKDIEFVIFDVDGLMIDSERVYTDVTNEILAQYGAEMTWEMKAGLMGKPQRPAAEHLLSFFPKIPLTIDDYLAQRTAGQDARWPYVQLLPGVARLVTHLAAHGIPIAIATGSVRRNFERKTAHLQHVFVHFGGYAVCGDDGAGRGKPFPDVFLAAARALGRAVGPNEEGDVVGDAEREERARGLVFEDAIPGVQAGKRAGMNVVWVPDENLLSVQSSQVTEQPDQVLRSLEGFVPEEWGLPPYDDMVAQQSRTE